MANPSALNATTAKRSVIAFTQANGANQSPTVSTSATLTNALQNAPSLLGVDAIPFAYTLTGAPQSFTLGFPSLVKRNNLNNPINPTQATGTPLVVAVSDRVCLLTLVQSMAPGVAIAVEGQAVDAEGTVYPGPFIGPGTYQKLQVVLTIPAGAGSIQGWIVGLMSLSVG